MVGIRRWRRTVSDGPPAAAEELTVVSYNILADVYATSGVHSYCEDHILDWKNRGPRIWDEISQYKPDILCLQEIEAEAFESELLPLLPDHDHVFHTRDTGVGVKEGVALLTKRSRVELLDSRSVTFADHIPSCASGESRETLAMRDDGAVLALLQDRVSRRQFVFVGTHLFFNPWWPEVKLLQAQILTQHVQQFLASHQQAGEPLPFIVAGDFNSLWRKWHSDPFDEVPFGEYLTSGVFDLLSTGRVAPSHSDHPLQRALLRKRPEPAWQEVEFKSDLAPLHSAYTQDGTQPPLSTKTATFAGNIDYIWLSEGWQVKELLAMPYEAAPGTDAAELPTFKPMPNESFPSDHLALGAKLKLLPADEPES